MRALRRSWGHPLLVLYAADNATAASRVGIVAGRRVGKAVVRNRVKRRVREAVRARLPRLRGGKDLVWIARPASATATYAEIVAAVDDLLGRSRLLGNLAGAKQ